MTITAPATARYGFESHNVFSAAGQCHCFAYAPNTGAWVFSGAAGVSENGTCLTSGNPPTPQMTRTAFLQTGGRMAITVTPAFAGAGSPQTRRWARLTGSDL